LAAGEGSGEGREGEGGLLEQQRGGGGELGGEEGAGGGGWWQDRWIQQGVSCCV
jgi:hypothetical protein